MYDFASVTEHLAAEFGIPLTEPLVPVGEFPEWQCVAQLVTQIIGRIEEQRDAQVRVLAVSGSQGSGKTTLAKCLAETLSAGSMAAAAVSLDDFYLTRKERRHLAATVHPLLVTRGVPGTHDVSWLRRVLAAARDADRLEAGGPLVVPRFDKGLDDRAGSVEIRPRTLILEGWCLGAPAQDAEGLSEPVNALERTEDAEGIWRRWVNRRLLEDYVPLWSAVDFWVHLRAPSFAQVRAWRAQQETDLPRDQRMSGEQLERFLAHYERITRWMWASPWRGPGVMIELDERHGIARVAAKPYG